MSNQRPINIIYEIVIVGISIVVVYQNELISSGSGWGEFYLIIFLLGISSITARAILKNAERKRPISAFLFGYVFGIYLWSLYSITEFIAIKLDINIINILNVVFGILIFGLIIALLSSAVSFLFEKVIRKMWKLN